MSARPPEVLERNLEALFQRAWQPVAPRPAFVARLERELAPWLAGAAPRRRAWPRFAAAAAVLLVAGLLGWRALGPGGDPGPRGDRFVSPDGVLLRRGEVALRELPDGVWRAATAGELRAGLHWTAPPDPRAGLELATPPPPGFDVLEAHPGFELRDAGGLSVVLEPRTRAWIERGVESRELRLALGGLELRAAGTPAQLTTEQGRVRLDDAAARVAVVPTDDGRFEAYAVLVEVLAGRALLDAGRGPIALVAPGRAVMQAGEVRVLDEAREPAGTDARRPDEPAPASPSRAEDAPPQEAPTAEPTRVALSGVVRDASGEPVTAFEVTLLRAVPLPAVAWPESRAFEDAAGRFAWDGLESGEYSVLVQASGRAPWRARGLHLAPGAPVELTPALPAGATVRGVVLDRATGTPIAGALVVSESDAPVQVLPIDAAFLPPEVRARALTGADGRFELAHLSPGSHVLRAGGAGRAFARSQELELREGELRTGVVLELSAGGGVEGRVEREGGRPRVGARVIASEQAGFGSRPSSFGMAVTDAEGRYRIGSLAAGPYVLLVAPEEQDSADMRPDIRAVVVAEGDVARADFLRATANATLRGRLLDAAGEPVPGATVNVSPPDARGDTGWRAATAQEDGAFALGDLAPGEYEVHLGAGSGIVRRERVRLAPGEVLEREYRLEGQSLEGSVTDAETGAAVDGYVLLLAPREGADAGRRVPATGEWLGKSWPASAVRFELCFVPAGLYDLVALTEDGSHALEVLEAIAVAADAPTRVDVALRPGGGALVRVGDAAGAPVAGAQVELTDPFGRRLELLDARTDAQGLARLDGLAPGRWSVRASAAGRGAAEASLSIDAGARRELLLALEP